jgi:two-component system, NtrC family, response regulator AtoC
MNNHTTIIEPGSLQGEPEGDGFAMLVITVDAFVSVPLPARGSVVIGRSNASDVQLEDPLASRQHARLHLDGTLQVEDLASSNGTRLREALLPPHTPVALAAGEALSIGSTVLVVQPARRGAGLRRIWSHRWFENRLRDECVRSEGGQAPFALVRLSLEQPVVWSNIVPVIDRELASPHVFAAYGPFDYEILLLGIDGQAASDLVERLRAGLEGVGVPARAGVAFYPRDGRTPDTLMAQANARLRPAEDARRSPDKVVASSSPAMDRVLEVARRAARSPINILIVGETGVGKEVMAQMIHQLSSRGGAPLLALNCAGLSETLIESELFGHERGAFTGAVQSKRGLFEAAEGGTLFLDEVGEMPPSVQAKVLRAVANREILPVGSVKPRPIDVRIVAATNLDLEKEVEEGTFRRDLYYRLNGITLLVPPLRERQAELPELTRAFVAQAARDAGREPPVVADEAMNLLLQYRWPGNIRELKNVVERAMVLCEGPVIDLGHLPVDKMGTNPPVDRGSHELALLQLTSTELAERQRMIAALEANVWNQSRAAKMLNIPRRTFVAKLQRYRIPRPQKGAIPAAAEEPDETP